MSDTPNLNTESDELTAGKLNFSYLKSENAVLDVPATTETNTPTKRRGRPPKAVKGDDIVKATGEVVNTTLDSYSETNNLIRQTIGEVDTLTLELKEEMDNIRSSRTLKNKYMYLTNISGNIGALLSTKIAAIKELNTVIKNANEFDYKKQKDTMANTQDSDQQIYALYNAFVNSPVNNGGTSALGPNTLQMSLNGGDLIRANSDGSIDAGIQNFRNTMTPEQRMMIMEDQVKEVIVYDKATGAKYFDVIDQNGNSVPGVPRKDPMFLEDYVINASFTYARNTNLNSTIPVVVINAGARGLGEY